MSLTEAPKNVPCLDVDPFSDEPIADPYPLLAFGRAKRPLLVTDKGVVLVTPDMLGQPPHG